MDLSALDAALTELVRPATFPLAIQLVEREDELAVGVRRPLRDLGVRVTICQAIGMARRYGWALGIMPEDISCPLVFVPFGFARPVAIQEQGLACAGIYTETLEAGARSEAVVPRLPTGRYAGIQIAPLARARFEPHVICIYGNAAQVMRLVQGALWHDGGALQSISAGRVDCAEIIIRTLQIGSPHYILPCSGDRIFGMTDDDEMAFAMLPQHADQVVAGLRGTHRGGIRYPIPRYMRYTVQFPDAYESLRAAIERSEDGSA